MDAFPEAQRWLSVAERLLTMRDFQSARTFAIRAHEADPRLEFSDRILAVADTLIAGESLVNNSFVDYYAVLQLARWTQNVELIASQYRKLGVLLNPNVNNLAFAEQAFRLISDAWTVLSNTGRKAMYDRQLELNLANTTSGGGGLSFQRQWVQQPQSAPMNQSQPPQMQWDLGGSSFVQQVEPQQRVVSESNWLSSAQREQQLRQQVRQQELQQQSTQVDRQELRQQQQQSEVRQDMQQQGKQFSQQEKSPNAAKESVRVVENEAVVEEEEEMMDCDDNVSEEAPRFWTVCPYCFYLYEYLKKYEECTLRCQHCERAFEAMAIPTPQMKGKDGYFCCWGFYPLGCPRNVNNSGGFTGWSPISPMFACPIQGDGKGKDKKAPRFVFADDDVFVEVSDHSDDDYDDNDWTTAKTRKRTNGSQGRSPVGKNVQSEGGKKGVQSNGNMGDKVIGGSVTNLSNGEPSRNGVGIGEIKQTGKFTRGMGRLDLNIEFSNDAEEASAAANQRNKARSGVDDNIEGTGFFEGLDEFLSTLPILNGVGGDDKVKAA